MLELKTMNGQTVFINPDAVISIQREVGSAGTWIRTIGSQSGEPYVIIVNDDPKEVANWFKRIKSAR